MKKPRQRIDATEAGDSKIVSLAQCPLDPVPQADGDAFDSITQPGNGLYLRAWHEMASARTAMNCLSGHRRIVHIIRDYGMFARTEAPQYFPP